MKICKGPSTCLEIDDSLINALFSDGKVYLKNLYTDRVEQGVPWWDTVCEPLNSASSSIIILRKMTVPDYALLTIFNGAATTTIQSQVRRQDPSNFYYLRYYVSAGTKYLEIGKNVAGTFTSLASETITYAGPFYVNFEVEGSTLTLYEGTDLSSLTATLTATDTTFTSPGSAGVMEDGLGVNGLMGIWFKTLAPSSPRPKPVMYLEVELVGSGKPDDPIRPGLRHLPVFVKNVVLDPNAVLNYSREYLPYAFLIEYLMKKVEELENALKEITSSKSKITKTVKKVAFKVGKLVNKVKLSSKSSESKDVLLQKSISFARSLAMLRSVREGLVVPVFKDKANLRWSGFIPTNSKGEPEDSVAVVSVYSINLKYKDEVLKGVKYRLITRDDVIKYMKRYGVEGVESNE